MVGLFRTPIRKRQLLERSLCGAGALLLAGTGAAFALAPGVSSASSHREAPLIAGDPKADNTDVYAFVSPDKSDTVTLVSNWIPFEEPNGGPNFYPFANDAQYNIKIDNKGDGKAHIVYTWKFTDHVRDAEGQFLYNTGVVNNADRPDAELLPDLHPDRDRRRRGAQDPGRQRDRGAVGRRPGLDAELRLAAPAGHHRAARRRSDPRRPGRRPVLPGPAGVRPALRREPEGVRAQHPGGLQRQHHRAAGAQVGPGPGRRRRAATR